MHAISQQVDPILLVWGWKYFYRVPSLKTAPSPQDGMIAHFKAVAEVGIPMMLYNIPGRCGGGGMTSGTIAELWKLPMVCSIKEATGSVDFASEIKSLCDIPIFSGLHPLWHFTLAFRVWEFISPVSPDISMVGMNLSDHTLHFDSRHASPRSHLAFRLYACTSPVPPGTDWYYQATSKLLPRTFACILVFRNDPPACVHV